MKDFFTIVIFIIVIVIGFFIVRGIWNFGYDKFGPKDYTAFYYPEPDDLSIYSTSKVDSVEECRDWVDGQTSTDYDQYFDYECGVNCKIEPGYTAMICKKTVQ